MCYFFTFVILILSRMCCDSDVLSFWCAIMMVVMLFLNMTFCDSDVLAILMCMILTFVPCCCFAVTDWCWFAFIARALQVPWQRLPHLENVFVRTLSSRPGLRIRFSQHRQRSARCVIGRDVLSAGAGGGGRGGRWRHEFLWIRHKFNIDQTWVSSLWTIHESISMSSLWTQDIGCLRFDTQAGGLEPGKLFGGVV